MPEDREKMPAKKEEIIKEVLDEIEAASKDPRGIVAHQRRLALTLSLGATTLLELYFRKLNIWKEGSQLNHLWFRKKRDHLLEQLRNQIVSPIKTVPKIDEILNIIIKIEEKRDEIAYGSSVDEKILQEKINLFFALQNLVK